MRDRTGWWLEERQRTEVRVGGRDCWAKESLTLRGLGRRVRGL